MNPLRLEVIQQYKCITRDDQASHSHINSLISLTFDRLQFLYRLGINLLWEFDRPYSSVCSCDELFYDLAFDCCNKGLR